jgi:dTMP kinase
VTSGGARAGAAGVGRLIVIEGIDGAGTTTQARRLVAGLQAAGRDARLTREPSDGPIGQLLRAILGGAHTPVPGEAMSAATLALLFAADRADHLQREVEPALTAGAVVVSDRWYHSSLAYQGSDEDRAWIRELNRRARRPDLTILLEVAPEVAAARRSAARRPDELFDPLATQRRVARGYREVTAALAGSEWIEVIDGDRPPDAVAADIARLADEACAGRTGSSKLHE